MKNVNNFAVLLSYYNHDVSITTFVNSLFVKFLYLISSYALEKLFMQVRINIYSSESNHNNRQKVLRSRFNHQKLISH